MILQSFNIRWATTATQEVEMKDPGDLAIQVHGFLQFQFNDDTAGRAVTS